MDEPEDKQCARTLGKQGQQCYRPIVRLDIHFSLALYSLRSRRAPTSTADYFRRIIGIMETERISHRGRLVVCSLGIGQIYLF